MKQGMVFDSKRFSIHDGRGIRTTVFLKGCPLRCRWCHNPEGLLGERELWYFESKCIGCGLCAAACPHGALALHAESGRVRRDSGRCVTCGACVKVCPAEALAFTGERMTVQQVVEQLEQDALFYRLSGGGVTLSGGEPLVQWEFCRQILQECRIKGIPTAMETCLFADREALDAVLPLVDDFIADIKLLDRERHRQMTGVDNSLILENFRYLAKRADSLLVRLPLIPGCTDDAENVRDIARFVKGAGAGIPMELMNYNPLAPAKYRLMDRPYLPGDSLQKLGKDRMEFLYGILAAEGVPVIKG